MKAHRRSLGALTAFLVCSTGAHGWEAFCRNQQFLREKNAIRESLSLVWQSTCSAPSPRLENLLRGVFPYAPECADGLEAARGSMLGEHRWITEKAMIKVGLGIPFDTGTYILGAPSIPYNPHDFHLYENNGLVLDYYLDGSNVVGAADFVSLEPAGAGGMFVHSGRALPREGPAVTKRPMWLPEFSELPDSSYSLSDFILGNEHCLPPHALLRYGSKITTTPLRDKRDQINACHAFKSHMGSVNSTHFGTQARVAYNLYHGLALQVAARCKAMWNAIKGSPAHPMYVPIRDKMIRACEREALTLEALGAHYMEDVWSTGHMWERWGSPNFDPDIAVQLRASIVGAVSGVEHGWRYLAQRIPDLAGFLGGLPPVSSIGGPMQHDQLCMPGPADPANPTSSSVRWTYPGNTSEGADTYLGGGDLYLFACNARERVLDTSGDPTWAVAGGANFTGLDGEASPNLGFQYKRMLTCVALGFEAVYQGGPGSDPVYRAPLQSLPDDAFDTDVVKLRGKIDGVAKDAYQRLCLTPRVTNQSMLLGSGITGWGPFHDPSIVGGFVLNELPNKAVEKSEIDHDVPDERQSASAGHEVTASVPKGVTAKVYNDSQLRLSEDLVKLAFFEQRAGFARGEGGKLKSAPYFTDVAEMTFQRLPESYVPHMLDFTSNADYAHLIAENQVPYLEHGDVRKWNTTPVSNVAGAPDCFDDTNCPARTYCDRSSGLADATATPPRLRHRCIPHEAAILRAFRHAEAPYWCANDSIEDMEAARLACQTAQQQDACDACIRIVQPHIRNAAHPTAYLTPKADGVDRRSACDLLKPAIRDALGLGDVDARLEANSLYVPYSVTPSDPGSNPPPPSLFHLASHVCRRLQTLPTRGPSSPTTAQKPIAPTVSAGVVKTCDGSVLMLGSSPPVVADVAFLLPGSALDRWVLPFPTQTPGFAYNPLFGVHTEDIASLSVNEFSNACFVRGADGTVWCSGSNPVGQLGNGGTTASNFPRRVAKLEGMADVSILGATTCALGRVGDVWCWGDNAFGGLGNGTSGGFSATPQPVAGLSSGAVELTRCARTPSGSIYCPTGPCARTAAGGVLCWGVGDGRGQQLTVPAPVQGLQGVARLGGSSCAVLDTGRVACWRWVGPGPSDPPPPTCVNPDAYFNPVFVLPDIMGAAEISGPCVRTNANEVRCWNPNNVFYDPCSMQTPRPVNPVTILTDVVALGAGGWATKRDGSIWHREAPQKQVLPPPTCR